MWLYKKMVLIRYIDRIVKVRLNYLKTMWNMKYLTCLNLQIINRGLSYFLYISSSYFLYSGCTTLMFKMNEHFFVFKHLDLVISF